MKIFLSTNTLKKQTKVLIKKWPVKASKPYLKTSEARNLLCLLYGYKNDHHYRKLNASRNKVSTDAAKTLLNKNLAYFIQRMDFLTDLGQNQSYALLKALWPDYLGASQAYLHQCEFFFFGELNIFLPKTQRGQTITYQFNDFPSIKDSIEALGIPHPEVSFIEVNQAFVDLSYQIRSGDIIKVYPCDSDHAEKARVPLNAYPKKRPAFVLDVHLGALARYLRMAGFDTFYEQKDPGDEKLSQISEEEERIILSRDINLLKRSNITYGRFVRSKDKREQFEDIIRYYNLSELFKPFQHCIECNGNIVSVKKERVASMVPPLVYESCDEFKQCSQCQKVYWKGSHYDRMMTFLEQFESM